MSVQQIADGEAGVAGVRGYLHRADDGRDGIVLTHGAGSNCNSPLLAALADSLCTAGITVLRCDLPFRQLRPKGPPLGTAKQDQAGLLLVTDFLRQHVSGRIFLGGHSYGGRMASMLVAENPSAADGLLLLSYPLHPPRKPEQLRTAHFPELRTRALFVRGTHDPFASEAELASALTLIPAETKCVVLEGAGHELAGKTPKMAAEKIAQEFQSWMG